MAVIDVYDLKGKKTSQMELNEEIFGVPVKEYVLHQVVVSQLHNRRSGCARVKGRSEVKASGAKLWRQKGTGRARVGGASSPTRRGGGVAFGPKARTYTQSIPKKVRKGALRMALSDKFQNDLLRVVLDFNLPEIKTRQVLDVMNDFGVKKALIITEDINENLERSSNNVPWVKVMRFQGLNVYDILNHEHLFLVQSAIPKIEEALIR